MFLLAMDLHEDNGRDVDDGLCPVRPCSRNDSMMLMLVLMGIVLSVSNLAESRCR